ncbi:3-oxoacyl-[acyl-carrier-protein] synthase III C-terminal domain-containing protein [Litoribacillus peritrichatus]|uniref:Beta-ketoacyl-[acyl-carrier-protein] synthase III C-terminal domain-containing protein n=1 Tax=Litoribacillus peritrichatus TaxID=718191 RepID=A0ABP7M727_9GAMM
MSSQRLFIRNCEHFVSPSCHSVQQEADKGVYEAQEWDNTQYKSVSLLREEDSLSLIQRIIDQLTLSSGVDLSALSMITFSSIHRAGYGAFWQPASYIQEKTNATKALTCGIQQGCNSQLIALELIISYLKTNPDADSALTMSVDSFEGSAFNRWSADYGILYGDGGAGAIVSKDSGDYEILSLVTECHGELNGLHRLPEHYNDASEDSTIPYNIKVTKKNYLNQFGIEQLSNTSLSAVKQVTQQCLEQHQLTMKDVSKVILPNLGQKILENNYLPALDVPLSKTLWSLGSTIGHVGSADAFISLSHLHKTNALSSGEKVLVISAGSGFTWSALLLEVC